MDDFLIFLENIATFIFWASIIIELFVYQNMKYKHTRPEVYLETFRLIFLLSIIPAYITVFIYDANHNNVAWIILDIVFFPISFLRGYYIWFS